MTNVTHKQSAFTKIEFWAATTFFVFLVFFHITNALNINENRYSKTGIIIPFDNYFFPMLARYVFLYAAFLVLNFKVVPALLEKKEMIKNVSLLLLVFVATGVLFGATDTYLKYYLLDDYPSVEQAHTFIYRNSFLYATWLLLLFGFYSIIKQVGMYLLSNAEAIQAQYKFVTRNVIGAVVVWMIALFLLIAGSAEWPVITAWAIMVPFAIILYAYAFHSLIPKALPKKRPFLFYIGVVSGILAIAYVPFAFIFLLLVRHGDGAFALSFFNALLQLSITAPFAWLVYKRHIKGSEEVYFLKKELGRSHASFDFLRSQINPHFLFNALNTIYGTAIQENAERTGEGIEKLGSMMRFMLQENMQEKIALTREIEYLNNYIDLQKLRTDTNPVITIETDIEQQVSTVQIAPMLLIPFVENAFKHGISFQERSFIRVSLSVKNKTLEFDVNNSKHNRLATDPEKDKSGIGLTNVKQRLQLLYPGRHEVIIRETGKEFFVHLTIRLS